MFKRGIRLPFTLAGVPVILDWSFLLVLPLLAWIIGSQIQMFMRLFDLPESASITRGAMPLALGLTAALGLFLGVLLHELGHAVTARLYGVEVRSIHLWFLGGVAQFERMPRQPGAEAVVAIAGPLVSLALGGIAWLILRALPDEAIAARFVLAYLTSMNIVLAVFNMIPALPLDGGRVLRSLLSLIMPPLQATRIAAAVSRVCAGVIAFIGLISFNFFLLLIALFIFMAVSAETNTSRVEELLRDVPARRIMNRDVRTVPPDMPVAELLACMLRERHLGFPVTDAGRVVGMVDINDVEGVDPATPVQRVMTTNVPVVHPDDDATTVFETMTSDGTGRVVVTDDAGRLVGIVTKTDLLRLIQLRTLSPDLATVLDGDSVAYTTVLRHQQPAAGTGA